MKHVSAKQAIGVWLFLVAASVATGWLADHHSVFGTWTVAVVLLVAVFKARAIILYYMELKVAPLQLRLPFEVWVLFSGGVILGFWLWA